MLSTISSYLFPSPKETAKSHDSKRLCQTLNPTSLKKQTPPRSTSPQPGDLIETEMGTVIIQKDDGNCLFRSFATGLSFHEDALRKIGKWDLEAMDAEEMHTTLRERTVAWMRSTLKAQEDSTFQAYLVSTIQDAHEMEAKKIIQGEPVDLVLIDEQLKEFSIDIRLAIASVEKYSKYLDSKDKNHRESAKRSLEIWLGNLYRAQKEYGDLMELKAKAVKSPCMPQKILSSEDYINELSKKGFFAGLSDIYALAQMYTVDIVIHHASDQHVKLHEKDSVTILGGPEGEDRPKIYLEYINGNHYNTILPNT